VNETASNATTVLNLTSSYVLPTTYYKLFLFINDTSNAPQSALINVGTIAAYCNNTQLFGENGYFKATTACSTNLTIINTVTLATIFYQSVFSYPIVTTIKLARYVFPTLFF
jgi:hypothetical protein